MNCIDRLGGALSRVVSRPLPPREYFDDDGQLRVLCDPVTFPDLLKDSFAHTRQYGSSTVAVAIRLIKAFHRIALESTDETYLAAIRAEADAVQEQFLKSDTADIDVRDFNERFEKLKKMWEGENPMPASAR